MDRKNAFGTIELLLGMVIMAAIFAVVLPSLYETNTMQNNSLKNPNENVQQADYLIKEINRMKRAPIDMNGSLG